VIIVVRQVNGSEIDRHLSVLYNSEARTAAENEGVLPLGDREADDSGAYFYPLLYNAEVLYGLVCDACGFLLDLP
jgi:hypothetical protein